MLTNFSEEHMLRKLMGNINFPSNFPPSKYFFTVFLNNTNITDADVAAGPSATLIEPSDATNGPGDAAFIRIELVNNTANFQFNDPVVNNNVAVIFNGATANWGTVNYAAAYDAAAGGNCMFYGKLDDGVLINTGDLFLIAKDALSFTLN